MSDKRPDLIIHAGDLPATVEAASDLLAKKAYRWFDRGTLVRIVEANGALPHAETVTPSNIVMEVHRRARPIQRMADGTDKEVTFPDRGARMLLEMTGEWGFPRLNGITSSPILGEDGGVHAVRGYDSKTGLWCCCRAAPAIPEQPSRKDAERALAHLRETFRTFPFADAVRCRDKKRRVDVVDTKKPPGADESGFLIGLLTAVCRASLWISPGLMIAAPAISGAGSGKGLLARAISIVAFGSEPFALGAGHSKEEMDKRIASALVSAQAMLFLDNINGTSLRSHTLASAITERPSHIRPLGATRLIELSGTTFILLTGNGLSVSEDLARRFLHCILDPKVEDPEQRDFGRGFLSGIKRERKWLLTDALTIWRWGRQNIRDIRPGKPLGSFEQWGEWVRDPLFELGCADPVERLSQLKSNDPERQGAIDILSAWYQYHEDEALPLEELNAVVKGVIDPTQKRTRQFINAKVNKLVGTRVGGLVLTKQPPAGRWGTTYYQVKRTD